MGLIPLVLDFIDDNAALPDSIKPKRRRKEGAKNPDCGAVDTMDNGKMAV